MQFVYKHALLLFEQEQYEHAIIELKRILFYSDTLNNESIQLIAKCNEQLNRPDRAIEAYNELYRIESNDSLRLEVKFEIIRLYLLSEKPIYAIQELVLLDTGNSLFFEQKKRFYLSLVYFRLNDYGMSHANMRMFLELVNDNKHSAGIDSLFNEAARNYSRSSKGFVIASGLVPGSGMVMNGFYKDGINSFLLNTIIITSSVYASMRLHPFDALLTFFPLISRYYIGGLQKTKELAGDKKVNQNNIIYNELLKTIQSILAEP